MSRILITGGLGYIGSHISIELIKQNFDVYIIDNLSNSSETVANNIHTITGKKINFFNEDLRNYDFLNLFFKKNKIDAVIHCAGLKAVNESIYQPLKYYNNNLDGTLKLLNAMKFNNIKKIIFSSSATVYDEDELMPVSENSKIGFGKNPYARSKIFIEKILSDLFKCDPSWEIIILRYFNPAGNHPSCLIGEDPIDIPNNLMPLIARSAFNLGTLTIFGNDYNTPDGTAMRDYIHVSDLANGHYKSLQMLLNKNSFFSIFNLGLGYGSTVIDVIKTYQKINKINIDYKFGDRRDGDIGICYADSSNAKKILNWIPEYNLEDICLHSYGWMKNKLKNS